MDPISVGAFTPVALNAVSALRPLQVGGAARTTTLSSQDLAQGVFQRTLQAATSFPLAEPATGSAGLFQEATASLLAALSAPQATANATSTSDATTNPLAVQPPGTATSPSPTPPTTVLSDVPATQDAFATSSGADFAMQTALRFGAGVLASTAPSLATTDQGAGLVRDATSVSRLDGLQARAGSPGPEAFTRSMAAIGRVLRDYQVTPATQPSGGLDLMA